MLLYNLLSSNSLQMVPCSLASGNLDQLNDFNGLLGCGMFFFSMRCIMGAGGGAIAEDGIFGAGGGGGGAAAIIIGGGGGGIDFGDAFADDTAVDAGEPCDPMSPDIF